MAVHGTELEYTVTNVPYSILTIVIVTSTVWQWLTVKVYTVHWVHSVQSLTDTVTDWLWYDSSPMSHNSWLSSWLWVWGTGTGSHTHRHTVSVTLIIVSSFSKCFVFTAGKLFALLLTELMRTTGFSVNAFVLQSHAGGPGAPLTSLTDSSSLDIATVTPEMCSLIIWVKWNRA